jgi:methanogenic corrinoid protein MtbC1
MFQWCPHCSRFVGEAEPFEDSSVAFGACARCQKEKRLPHENVQALTEGFTSSVKAISRTGESAIEETVRSAERLGIRKTDLLIGLIQSLLYEVGDEYQRQEISVAEEHAFTASVERLLLALEKRQRHRSTPRLDALLICCEGNYHSLGIRFLQFALREQGIAALALYPSLPVDEVVPLTKKLRPKLLGVSVSLPEQMKTIDAIGARLDEGLAPGEMPVRVAGGHAISVRHVPPGDAFMPYSGNLEWLTRQIQGREAA